MGTEQQEPRIIRAHSYKRWVFFPDDDDDDDNSSISHDNNFTTSPLLLSESSSSSSLLSLPKYKNFQKKMNLNVVCSVLPKSDDEEETSNTPSTVILSDEWKTPEKKQE